jgi:hypothetical protein
MEIVERIVGAYIPLCCLGLPVLIFFALVAVLPTAFLALSSQGSKEKEKETSTE